jgi:hypothetical protein
MSRPICRVVGPAGEVIGHVESHEKDLRYLQTAHIWTPAGSYLPWRSELPAGTTLVSIPPSGREAKAAKAARKAYHDARESRRLANCRADQKAAQAALRELLAAAGIVEEDPGVYGPGSIRVTLGGAKVSLQVAPFERFD